MQLVHLKLVLTMTIWGGTFIAGRIVAATISPFTASFYRFIVASVVLLVLVYRQPTKLPQLQTKQIPLILLLGLSGVFAYNAFFFLGLQTIPASRAGLIIALNPVAIAISSRFVFGERLTSLKIVGIGSSLLGVALIITEGDLTTLLSGGVGRGELFILGCVASWTIYSLAGKQIMKQLSPLVATTYAVLVGTIALLPFAIKEQYSLRNAIAPLTGLSLLYLGAFGTVIAFNWYYQGIQAIGAQKASIFINLVPVFALLFGILFLQETITAILLIGGGLVIFGVSLVNQK